MPPRGTPVDVLVRFAHVVAEELEPEGALRALADAAVAEVGADAAGVFLVTPQGGVRLVASRNLPDAAGGLEVEALGPELAEQVQRACGAGRAVHLLPMVSGGDLFGALVLVLADGRALDPAGRELAQALVDLTALAQRTAAQLRDLRRTNSELRAAREALGRSEKLGALGQLAAGVAHDMSNVLAPLVGDAANLKASADERTAKVGTRMARYLNVGAELLERLRRFARQAPESVAGAVDPGPALRDAVELCQARARERRVELRPALDPVPAILVHAGDLTSGLVNLIVNAIDAQPQGGSVDVRAGTDAQGQAWIEVQDAGPGIPERLRARIFEPFFTTKGERGTGLGLANVYAFVQRHRGTIGFTTADGAGTTFRLEFPPGARASS